MNTSMGMESQVVRFVCPKKSRRNAEGHVKLLVQISAGAMLPTLRLAQTCIVCMSLKGLCVPSSKKFVEMAISRDVDPAGPKGASHNT
jgi:hypothetical protein